MAFNFKVKGAKMDIIIITQKPPIYEGADGPDVAVISVELI